MQNKKIRTTKKVNVSFRTLHALKFGGFLTKVGFPAGSDGKKPACNAGDLGSIPVSGKSPGEGNGYPLQNFQLENPTDRGAWWATVHGLTKSWIWLNNEHFHLHEGILSTWSCKGQEPGREHVNFEVGLTWKSSRTDWIVLYYLL